MGAGGDHDRPRNPAARPRLLPVAYDATVFALVENFISVFSVPCHLANFDSPSLFDRRADWISRFFLLWITNDKLVLFCNFDLIIMQPAVGILGV